MHLCFGPASPELSLKLSDGHGVSKASRGPLRSDTQNLGAAARLCSTPSLGGEWFLSEDPRQNRLC